MSETLFPTADQIATAIVTACRVVGDGTPVMVATGGGGGRSRAVAFDALRRAFPDARRGGLARACGFPSAIDTSTVAARLAMARRASWWRDEYVDEVVGALLTDPDDASDTGGRGDD